MLGTEMFHNELPVCALAETRGELRDVRVMDGERGLDIVLCE